MGLSPLGPCDLIQMQPVELEVVAPHKMYEDYNKTSGCLHPTSELLEITAHQHVEPLSQILQLHVGSIETTSWKVAADTGSVGQNPYQICQ